MEQKCPQHRKEDSLTSSKLRLISLISHMAPSDDSKRIEEAQRLSKSEPDKAEATFKEILSKEPGSSEAALKNYEAALMGLGELYKQRR